MIELLNKCNNFDKRPNLEKNLGFGRRLIIFAKY